jgi:SAM-dependent methyltransferase
MTECPVEDQQSMSDAHASTSVAEVPATSSGPLSQVGNGGDGGSSAVPQHCAICQKTLLPAQWQRVRCNVRRFRQQTFSVWRCSGCRSLHCQPVENLGSYYEGYPIRQQSLDYFSRAWYRIVLQRLRDAGLRPEHRLLDFGCNRGLFLRYLLEQGQRHCVGYDPYVDEYKSADVLERKYDFVVSLDVIEHDPSPREFLSRLASLLEPAGRLCVETPNADGIDLDDSEEYLHALHVPYHVHILSRQGLINMAAELRLSPVATYRRWYMDSWQPGTARRLFESLLKYGDNDIDSGYEPPRIGLFFKHPSLFVHLLLGYFMHEGKDDHMMMIFAPGA